MRILHLVPRLVQGGAETLLINYVTSTRSKHEHFVQAIFADNAPSSAAQLGDRLLEQPVRSYLGVLRSIPRLKRNVRELRPDVVVGWMYHSAVLLGALAGSHRSVAYIHNTTLSKEAKYAERIAQRLLGKLARVYRLDLLYCGEASKELHERQLGYPDKRGASVSNGIPLEAFQPTPEMRGFARRLFGFSNSQFVFSCFGRFNPQKNWPLILDSLAKARAKCEGVKLLAAGNGVTMDNPTFAKLVDERGLRDQVVALGVQADMVPLYAASDTVMLGSTYGEAVPLVVIEALAMGKPVLANDVGSVREMLDDLCEPIPCQQPESFMATAVQAAKGRWAPLRTPASRFRERAVSQYGLDVYVENLDEALVRGLA